MKLPGAPRPGQHWALTGKTGEGKTTLAVGVLQTRKYVLALDPKGEDDTLAASGFRRVTALPPKSRFPRDIQRDLEEGRPVRLIVGGGSRTAADDATLRQLMEDALEYVRQAGGWTTYVDEFQLVGDIRLFRLGPQVERMLISARRDKATVITSFQAPAWVPKASTRQASVIVAWKTGDRQMMKNIAETAGRPWKIIEAVLDELPKYHVLVIPDDLRAPMMITCAPRIN